MSLNIFNPRLSVLVIQTSYLLPNFPFLPPVFYICCYDLYIALPVVGFHCILLLPLCYVYIFQIESLKRQVFMLSWDTSEMQSELWDRQLKYQDLRRDVFPEKMLDHISGYVCDRNVRY